MYQREREHLREADPGNGRGTRDHRSIGDLLKELRDETTTLFRQEVALAKTEISEKAAKAGRNAAYLAAGGAVAYLGLVFVLLAVTALIAVGLMAANLDVAWAIVVAPMITGIVVALIGYALIQKAISTFSDPERFVPRRTMNTLQENKRWAEHKMKT